MSQKAKTIGDDAATARAHCAALATESAAIHTGLEADLKQPADSALQGIHVLIASVQEYEAADKVSKIADNTLELLRKCKGQSAVVHTRFDELYNQAHALLDRSNKVALASFWRRHMLICAIYSCLRHSRLKQHKLRPGYKT